MLILIGLLHGPLPLPCCAPALEGRHSVSLPQENAMEISVCPSMPFAHAKIVHGRCGYDSLRFVSLRWRV